MVHPSQWQEQSKEKKMNDYNDAGLMHINSTEAADQVNTNFYQRFPYPWPPMKFAYLTDPHFETIMLNQSIGDWNHDTLPENPDIWVAGCGTNQAIFIALRFPESRIIASDLSTAALNASATIAEDLHITNLELREESINHVSYKEAFDYIVCTGVIHHNANPASSLKVLAQALKPDGILELMVYNKYHRITINAFQKAISILSTDQIAKESKYETELALAKMLLADVSTDNATYDTLNEYRDCPEPMLADTLLQPVEHCYNVESLDHMATLCGLELVCPCVNPFDKANDTMDWNMEFEDTKLQTFYDMLSDTRRWQVTNHLRLNESPMLWFYLQRQDSHHQRKTERQICEEFLNTRFVKNSTSQMSYILSRESKYTLSSKATPFPALSTDRMAKRVYDLLDSNSLMKHTIQRLGIKTTFQAVNRLRLRLTTSLFPYLKAIHDS
jgi:SAM-dependent methyltransferase